MSGHVIESKIPKPVIIKISFDKGTIKKVNLHCSFTDLFVKEVLLIIFPYFDAPTVISALMNLPCLLFLALNFF